MYEVIHNNIIIIIIIIIIIHKLETSLYYILQKIKVSTSKLRWNNQTNQTFLLSLPVVAHKYICLYANNNVALELARAVNGYFSKHGTPEVCLMLISDLTSVWLQSEGIPGLLR